MNPPQSAISAAPTPPALTPARLTRDRATWLLYVQSAVFAYFLYCFGPSVPLLGDDLGVSKAVAGLHSTAYALGGAIVGMLGSRPVRWWGRGPALWGGLALLAAGVLTYALGPWIALTLTGALLCGIGGFAVVNLVAAAVVDHHGPVAGPGALSEAHGIGAAVGMVAPLAIGGAQASGLGWRYGILATPVLILGVYALFRNTRIPGHHRDDIAELETAALEAAALETAAPERAAPEKAAREAAAQEPGDCATTDRATTDRETTDHETADPAAFVPQPATRQSAARLPSRYWWAWLMIVCLVAVEFSLSLWASDLLEDRAGLSEGAAATGMTAVVAGLCVGRITGGRLVLRHPLGRIYALALAVNAAGFAALWLSTTPWLSFAGLFVAGLGMSVQFPLAMARSIEAAEGRADLAASRSALATALAAGGAPFLLGLLADTFDTWKAFAIIPVFLLLAVPALLLSGRRTPPRTANPSTPTGPSALTNPSAGPAA